MRAKQLFPDVDIVPRGASEPTLIIDVDGFEGPLDLLLELARRQKIDLARISILALAEQYLAFVDKARAARLELAADYLVMAAWLAYLKSRLLLPEAPADDAPSAADLATALAFRLRRLEALRTGARLLADRDRLGREVFARGAPEPLADVVRPQWQASLYDLLAAYARRRQTQANARVTVAARAVWSLAEASALLQRLVGMALDWTGVDEFLLRHAVEPAMRATMRASSLAAILELVKDGQIEIRQEGNFAPLWLRRRAAPASVPRQIGA